MKIYDFQRLDALIDKANFHYHEQKRIKTMMLLGITSCYAPNLWKFYGYLNGTLMASAPVEDDDELENFTRLQLFDTEQEDDECKHEIW